MNKGFAGACNDGVNVSKKFKSEYIFIVSNDIVIKEDSIEYLIAEFQDEKVAIVGPKIYLGKTNILNSVGGYFDKKTLLKKEYGCKVEDKGQFDIRKEVEFVMGSAFMVRADYYHKLGGMDERFFMFTEETDLCYRTIKNGYKIIYTPKAIVWHEHGKTIGSFNNRVMYYQMRNNILMSQKNGKLSNAFQQIIVFHKSQLKSIFKKFIKSIFVFYKAIFDGLLYRSGKSNSRWLD